MVYVFLATGCEEVEALSPVDVMRRAGIECETVSISGEQVVQSSHNVGIVADRILSEIDFTKADALVLPGGLPGATNLDACEPLREGIMHCYQAGKLLAAICAGPLVYGHLGILNGRRATCYPGFETELSGAIYTAVPVEVDGQFVTGFGPAAAWEFGYRITEALGYGNKAKALREGMMYNKLVGID